MDYKVTQTGPEIAPSIFHNPPQRYMLYLVSDIGFFCNLPGFLKLIGHLKRNLACFETIFCINFLHIPKLTSIMIVLR